MTARYSEIARKALYDLGSSYYPETDSSVYQEDVRLLARAISSAVEQETRELRTCVERLLWLVSAQHGIDGGHITDDARAVLTRTLEPKK